MMYTVVLYHNDDCSEIVSISYSFYFNLLN